MICRARKIIFVHIPKCGGTSIESIVWDSSYVRDETTLWSGFISDYHNKYQSGGLQHLTARLIRFDVGRDVFQSCYKFAVVRNPLDRLVSQFKFLSRRPDLQKYIGLKDNYGFSDYLGRIERKEHVQWKPAVDFLLDDDGALLVDDFFKLEDLTLDATPLLRKLPVNAHRLEVTNSTAGIAPPTLTAEDRALVYSMYRDDFRVLGYPPPDG